MFVSRKTALPGVRAIDVFAAESHPWIRQPALQNGQRIDEAVASFHGLLRERLQNDRIALSIRFKTRMGGSLHEFCRNQNFAPVINLDNHRELLLSIIVRSSGNWVVYPVRFPLALPTPPGQASERYHEGGAGFSLT